MDFMHRDFSQHFPNALHPETLFSAPRTASRWTRGPSSCCRNNESATCLLHRGHSTWSVTWSWILSWKLLVITSAVLDKMLPLMCYVMHLYLYYLYKARCWVSFTSFTANMQESTHLTTSICYFLATSIWHSLTIMINIHWANNLNQGWKSEQD